MASNTFEILPTEHPENFELLGRSPLVAEANIIKLPSEPPGRHSVGKSCGEPKLCPISWASVN